MGRARELRLQLLEACDERIDDTTFIDIIIEGLGPEYSEFKSIMDYRPADMPFDDFMRDLHTAAAKARKPPRADADGEAYAMMRKPRDPRDARGTRPRHRCHVCEQKRHAERAFSDSDDDHQYEDEADCDGFACW